MTQEAEKIIDAIGDGPQALAWALADVTRVRSKAGDMAGSKQAADRALKVLASVADDSALTQAKKYLVIGHPVDQ